MKLQETLKRIKRIRRDITDERDISYDDTAFLQANQDIIKDYFDDDPVLYEWAGIPENLYGQKTRYTKGDCYAISEFCGLCCVIAPIVLKALRTRWATRRKRWGICWAI